MNIKQTVKGLSLLLCLGFLVSAGNVVAKTTLSDITGSKVYSDCADAQQYVREYQRLDNCSQSSQTVKSLQQNLESLCSAYKNNKSDFNKCTSGQKTSIDETQIRLGEVSEYAVQDRIKKVNQVSTDINKANEDMSACQSSLNSYLNKAKSAVSACEKTQKAADKADKKADKANTKEEKAKAAYDEAKQTYEACVASKGADNCSKEAKKLSNAAEDYNKKADKAQAASNKADEANMAVGQNKCASGEQWSRVQNGGQGGCVPAGAKDEDIQACNGTGFFRDKDGKCYYDKADRDAAEQAKLDKAKEEAQAASNAYDAAEKAYNECVKQNGLDLAKCATEQAAMESATSALASADLNLGQLGANMGSSVDKSLKAEAQAAAGGRKTTCEKELSTMDGLFSYLACRITVLVADLRVIVYILAGFGMIAFAYGAIIGKINFKQLANIGIGLFILSMTTSVIEYIAFDGRQDLKFRDYLPDGNHAQFDVIRQTCDNNPDLCPDAQIAGLKADAAKSSWSLSDLKNTIRSVKDGLKTASDAYSGVKSTVKTVTTAAQNIGNAITHGDNVIDSIATIATNVGNAMNTANNTVNMTANAASHIAGNIQDAGSSAAQREYREALRSQYNTLSQRCANGACSEAEQKSLANLQQQINETTTGVDNFLASTGGDILNDLQNVTDMANQGAEVGRAMKQGQIEGQDIGDNLGGGTLGDILGATFGATSAFTEGSDAINNLKEDGAFDFSSSKSKCENLGQPYAWQNNTCVDTCAAKTNTKEVFAWDKNTQTCVNKTQTNCAARSTANRTYKWNSSTKKCEEVTSTKSGGGN